MDEHAAWVEEKLADFGLKRCVCFYCGRDYSDKPNKGAKTCDGCGANYSQPIGTFMGIAVCVVSAEKYIKNLSPLLTSYHHCTVRWAAVK